MLQKLPIIELDDTAPLGHMADLASQIWMITPGAMPMMRPMGDRARWVRRAGINTAVEVEHHGSVAVVRCEGLAVRRTEYWEATIDGFSTESLAETVTRLAADSYVDGVVIWADSPGGEAHGVDAAARAIRAAGKSKPVIGQVQGVAHSAMFYLLCGCSEIYLHPEDRVGSIGVIAQLYDESERFKAAGVRPVTVATGALKGIGAPGEPITKEQREHVEHHVGLLFDQFKAFVAEGRRLSLDAVDQLAHGGIFAADEALAAGLVDGIATLEETIERVEKAASASRQQLVASSMAAVSVVAVPWSIEPSAIATPEAVLVAVPGATLAFAEEATAAGWTMALTKAVWMRRQHERLEQLSDQLTAAGRR